MPIDQHGEPADHAGSRASHRCRRAAASGPHRGRRRARRPGSRPVQERRQHQDGDDHRDQAVQQADRRLGRVASSPRRAAAGSSRPPRRPARRRPSRRPAAQPGAPRPSDGSQRTPTTTSRRAANATHSSGWAGSSTSGLTSNCGTSTSRTASSTQVAGGQPGQEVLREPEDAAAAHEVRPDADRHSGGDPGRRDAGRIAAGEAAHGASSAIGRRLVPRPSPRQRRRARSRQAPPACRAASPPDSGRSALQARSRRFRSGRARRRLRVRCVVADRGQQGARAGRSEGTEPAPAWRRSGHGQDRSRRQARRHLFDPAARSEVDTAHDHGHVECGDPTAGRDDVTRHRVVGVDAGGRSVTARTRPASAPAMKPKSSSRSADTPLVAGDRISAAAIARPSGVKLTVAIRERRAASRSAMTARTAGRISG